MFQRTKTKDINGIKVTITQAKSNYVQFYLFLFLTIACIICAVLFPVVSLLFAILAFSFGIVACALYKAINTEL
jgi:uncharacterized membrane protein